jgi:hypothetical protein
MATFSCFRRLENVVRELKHGQTYIFWFADISWAIQARVKLCSEANLEEKAKIQEHLYLREAEPLFHLHGKGAIVVTHPFGETTMPLSMLVYTACSFKYSRPVGLVHRTQAGEFLGVREVTDKVYIFPSLSDRYLIQETLDTQVSIFTAQPTSFVYHCFSLDGQTEFNDHI